MSPQVTQSASWTVWHPSPEQDFLALPAPFMQKGVLWHRGQCSGPDQNPPSYALSSSYELTRTNDFSASGLSFPIYWLRRHLCLSLPERTCKVNQHFFLPPLTLPATCMGQATGPVPAGRRDLSRCLGFCLSEGQTGSRLETCSQPTLGRPQPGPLLPDSSDLARTSTSPLGPLGKPPRCHLDVSA